MSTTDTSSLTANKPDHRDMVRGCTLFLTFLGLLFVSLRIWVRMFKKRSHGWDDYWIVAAAVRQSLRSKQTTFCAPKLTTVLHIGIQYCVTLTQYGHDVARLWQFDV